MPFLKMIYRSKNPWNLISMDFFVTTLFFLFVNLNVHEHMTKAKLINIF